MGTDKYSLITGVNGQDGAYLSRSLLDKGELVLGLVRRRSENSFEKLKRANVLGSGRFKIIEGDVTDYASLSNIFKNFNIKHVYNLAAQSHVMTSFSQPALTFDINANGPLYLLEIIRQNSPETHFYQASTSEMFGSNYDLKDDGSKVQSESTSFLPQSPYACAKLTAHNLVRLYRQSYGLYACSGILFNHESPLRGENFVTQKIVKWLKSFISWKTSCSHPIDTRTPHDSYIVETETFNAFPKLRLGNLESYRDFGYAGDYVEAMYMMINKTTPSDYVIATGNSYKVKDFLEGAFSFYGLDYSDYVYLDSSLYRPSEVDYLRGDASRATQILGWEPTVDFKQLIEIMITKDF